MTVKDFLCEVNRMGHQDPARGMILVEEALAKARTPLEESAALYHKGALLQAAGRAREAYEAAYAGIMKHPNFGYPSEWGWEICSKYARDTYQKGDMQSWRKWQLLVAAHGAAFAATGGGPMLLPTDCRPDEAAEAEALYRHFSAFVQKRASRDSGIRFLNGPSDLP